MRSAAQPEDAATVILVRRPLEVFLIRRPDRSRFMGGAWVFPGGKVDDSDGPGEDAIVRAAVREVLEEIGVTLHASALVPWARWVTPAEEPRRFDARFFLAELPERAVPQPNPQETTDSGWFLPQEAIARNRAGSFRLMPPTLRNIELLSSYSTVDALMAAAPGEVARIEPVLTLIDERIAIVLPGDPLHPERDRRVAGPTRIVFRDTGFVSEDP